MSNFRLDYDTLVQRMLKNGFVCDLKELKCLCKKWMKKLGLTYWNIDIKICRKSEMPTPTETGHIKFKLSDETALISILHPDDHYTILGHFFKYDMEVILVHELLHILMSYFSGNIPAGSLESICLEEYITRIARIIVAQDRRIKQLEKR